MGPFPHGGCSVLGTSPRRILTGIFARAAIWVSARRATVIISPSRGPSEGETNADLSRRCATVIDMSA